MTHPVQTAAETSPNAVLLQTQDVLLTATELRDAVQLCAGGLVAHGLGPGDIIGLSGPASADWLIALHAIGWMGGIAAPLPHGVLLQGQLKALAAKAVLTDSGTEIAHPNVLPLSLSGSAMHRPCPVPADSPALKLCTSGTTGHPRVVTLTWSQLDAAAQASQAHLGHRDDDAWLGCLPLHHIGGLSVFLRTIRTATRGVLHSGFDPQRVAQALESGLITQVSLVPSMLQSILDARGDAAFHRNLRLLLIGGAPMPSALLERCRTNALPVALSWGMTETAAQIATREPGDLRDAPDVGLPLPGLTVTSEEGMLVVQGPTAPGGKWVTSDRGTLDAQGRVIVWGRGSDLILSGGENIDPREVELELERHPDVAQAAVVGRADTRWGQRPIAFLVAEGGVLPSLDALRAHIADKLPAFKAPDAVIWVDVLPRGPLGKLRRSVLCDQVQADQAIQEL